MNRENLKWMGVGGAIALLAFIAGRMLQPPDPPLSNATFERIEANEIVIVDERGRTRTRLFVGPAEDPHGPIDVFQALNTEGSVVYRVQVYEEGASGGGVEMSSRSGDARVTMNAAARAILELSAGLGKPRVRIHAEYDEAEIEVGAPESKPSSGTTYANVRAVASLRSSAGSGVLSLSRVDDRAEAASVEAGLLGGVVTINNRKGERRAMVLVGDNGEGRISLRDDAGAEIEH